jgi:hypothetical protein
MTELAATTRSTHRSNSAAVAGNPVADSRLTLSGGISVIILPILVILLVLVLTGAGGLRS